ncbi:MAG: LysR family transcriptional regulator [Rhodobacteraceae bacterium]|nr:LysR family transcriptional regulator [Paracoccaceae bacterium]
MDTNWDDVRIFLAVARTGTLSAAARSLRVSQPTVSRRLSAMEIRQKVKLFDRLSGGYELTPAGHELFEAGERIENEFAEAGRKIVGRDEQLTGTLRITCTEVIANLYLSPHLSRFAVLHPGIDLNVLGTFQNLDLNRREADVAIRVSADPPGNLIGRRLARAALGVYVAKDSAQDYNADCISDDWNWLGWQDENYNQMLIKVPFPSAKIKHRVDDLQTMRSFARAGLGVATLPCYIADVDPGLARIISDVQPREDLDIWVLYHPDLRRVTRIRMFIDFICEAITADKSLFEGSTAAD